MSDVGSVIQEINMLVQKKSNNKNWSKISDHGDLLRVGGNLVEDYTNN